MKHTLCFSQCKGIGCFSHTKCVCLDASALCRAVTWLILPVVICLSQRLSHACLSINQFVRWNCEWLIISVIVYLMIPSHMDNRGNSRANTCTKSRLLEGMYLLGKNQPEATRTTWWFMITERTACPCGGGGSFKFLPYQLSMAG